MTTALVERLRDARAELARGVVDTMYEDPFWMARYAARGREHSEADLERHVDYLAQALAAADEGILRAYARWLQTVLTTRGMCTAHLGESFARLAALVAVRIPDSALAGRYLAEAQEALIYAAGSGRALQLASAAIAARSTQARGAMDHLISYMADAVVLDDASHLVAYVGVTLGVEREARDALASLERAVTAEPSVPREARERARDVLGRARDALQAQEG